MVVDVEKLSDAEIQTKLVEFGYPVMPITGTTRKTLLKKLKMLMENKEKTSKNDRRSLSRYSSEEESDNEATARKNQDKNRRITMAAPTAVLSRRSAIISNSEKKSPSVTTTTRRTTTTRVSSRSGQDEFETRSDSEPETTFGSPNFQHQPISYSTPNSDENDVQPSSYLLDRRPTPPRLSTFSTTETALERLNNIRSRLNLGNTDYERRPTYPSSFNANNAEPVDETPFLSNFTQRLSRFNPKSPITQEYGWKNDVIKEHDTNGNDYNKYSAGRPKYREPIRSYQVRNSSNVFKNNIVSFTVLGVALLFFVLVGVMYLSMRSGDTALETSGHVICKTESQRYGIDCINKSDLENTTKFMQTLKLHLAKRAVQHACSDNRIKPYMTEPEAINYYHQFSKQDIRIIQQQLQLLEVLVFKNPEPDVSILHVDGTGEIYDKNILNDMDEVIAFRPSQTIVLAVLHPDVPYSCILYNKIHSSINAFLVLAAGFLIICLSNYIWKYYKTYKQNEKDTVIKMAEQIIDILQSNTPEESENFIVINHIRDMILPIYNRKRMEKLWDQAVKFINDNESRIRTEIQVVKGEPFEVWRWISSQSTSPRSKSWQGQAFETQVGSVNSLPCSPTSCLKIRGMLDDLEQSAVVYDAVLSKCAHQCKILHCAIESNSSCVYLKCADQNEAAVAYRNLHGWWYAGHLVTVKYLRLERYMQRFPDSPASGPPFLKSQSPATDWSN